MAFSATFWDNLHGYVTNGAIKQAKSKRKVHFPVSFPSVSTIGREPNGRLM